MPKRKEFITYEEKIHFINTFKKKIKTELCKNWIFKGKCKFNNDVNYLKIVLFRTWRI